MTHIFDRNESICERMPAARAQSVSARHVNAFWMTPCDPYATVPKCNNCINVSAKPWSHLAAPFTSLLRCRWSLTSICAIKLLVSTISWHSMTVAFGQMMANVSFLSIAKAVGKCQQSKRPSEHWWGLYHTVSIYIHLYPMGVALNFEACAESKTVVLLETWRVMRVITFLENRTCWTCYKQVFAFYLYLYDIFHWHPKW